MELDEFRGRLLEERGDVERMARRLAGDPELAEDLAQETFMRALRAAPRFELREQGLRPWLRTILHNCFYTRIAQQRRRPREAGDLAESRRADAGPADPDELDWEWLDERLKRALEDLRPAYREVLLLVAVEGLKYREIAERLGVPIGTVMSRLSRARNALYGELGELAWEYGIASETATGSPA